jgi:NAD(P)-dependent dehydrogenase (short-subunit alcohol dehydrogenase family)
MKDSFKEKVVLVTGGTSGIGKTAALAFAREGAIVIISGRDQQLGEQILTQIQELSPKSEFIIADLSNAEQVGALFAGISEKHARLDCAFNAAGAEASVAPLAMQTINHFNEMVAVDMRGTFACMQHEIRAMHARGKGTIVNCAAMAGLRGGQGSSIYSACKHAIIGMTKSAALECAGSLIRINSVCPGIIQTPGLERTFNQVPEFSFEEVRQWGLTQIPMQRFGKPEEVAHAVLWLCSDESSYVTGHSLIIDGGMHCK